MRCRNGNFLVLLLVFILSVLYFYSKVRDQGRIVSVKKYQYNDEEDKKAGFISSEPGKYIYYGGETYCFCPVLSVRLCSSHFRSFCTVYIVDIFDMICIVVHIIGFPVKLSGQQS